MSESPALQSKRPVNDKAGGAGRMRGEQPRRAGRGHGRCPPRPRPAGGLLGVPGLHRAASASPADIDECVTGVHNCSTNETCFNVQGGFRCLAFECPENYRRSADT